MFHDSPMAKWVLLHCSVCWPAITVARRRLSFLKLDRVAPMTIERAQIVDYRKAPAAASAMHTEARQLLQLDLLGRVEPATPFKNHRDLVPNYDMSTDFQLKISTENVKKYPQNTSNPQ
jgi:hypothetical protein